MCLLSFGIVIITVYLRGYTGSIRLTLKKENKMLCVICKTGYDVPELPANVCIICESCSVTAEEYRRNLSVAQLAYNDLRTLADQYHYALEEAESYLVHYQEQLQETEMINTTLYKALQATKNNAKQK
jgi:hypothetical protein